jgi:hypothetical protein
MILPEVSIVTPQTQIGQEREVHLVPVFQFATTYTAAASGIELELTNCTAVHEAPVSVVNRQLPLVEIDCRLTSV